VTRPDDPHHADESAQERRKGRSRRQAAGILINVADIDVLSSEFVRMRNEPNMMVAKFLPPQRSVCLQYGRCDGANLATIMFGSFASHEFAAEDVDVGHVNHVDPLGLPAAASFFVALARPLSVGVMGSSWPCHPLPPRPLRQVASPRTHAAKNVAPLRRLAPLELQRRGIRLFIWSLWNRW